MEYPFIAIAPRFTQTRIGSTWKGPIYGSNTTKLCTYAKMNSLKYNCFCMLNWIVWNRTVFDIVIILILNWIIWNRTVYVYEMGINFYLLRTFCPHFGSFLCCFFFHYVSAKFHLWPSSGAIDNNYGRQ